MGLEYKGNTENECLLCVITTLGLGLSVLKLSERASECYFFVPNSIDISTGEYEFIQS